MTLLYFFSKLITSQSEFNKLKIYSARIQKHFLLYVIKNSGRLNCAKNINVYLAFDYVCIQSSKKRAVKKMNYFCKLKVIENIT